MAVYAAKSEMHKENERLRLTIAAARESAARAEEQAARLRCVATDHHPQHLVQQLMPRVPCLWVNCTVRARCADGALVMQAVYSYPTIILHV